MHVYLIASSTQIINKCNVCHVLIQVSQDGFMLRLICVFLGCDLPIKLLLKLLLPMYDNRLVDHLRGPTPSGFAYEIHKSHNIKID